MFGISLSNWGEERTRLVNFTFSVMARVYFCIACGLTLGVLVRWGYVAWITEPSSFVRR